MAELTPQERLQPSLLDRLTDEDPGNPKESSERRVMNQTQLKASVLRDLAWLLNTTALFDSETGAQIPAGSSVINFGLPPLSGHTASSIDAQLVESVLSTIIEVYEPRLLKGSLRVRARLAGEEMNHNALSFEIEADLWAEPVPMRLLFSTDLDLETGHIKVNPSDSGRRRA